MDLQFRFRASALKHGGLQGNIITEIEKETGMTDAECEYWDEYITKNPVHLGPDLVKLGVKPGFAHDYLPLNELRK